MLFTFSGNGGELQWCFSQVKGTIEEDVTEGTAGVCVYLCGPFVFIGACRRRAVKCLPASKNPATPQANKRLLATATLSSQGNLLNQQSLFYTNQIVHRVGSGVVGWQFLDIFLTRVDKTGSAIGQPVDLSNLARVCWFAPSRKWLETPQPVFWSCGIFCPLLDQCQYLQTLCWHTVGIQQCSVCWVIFVTEAIVYAWMSLTQPMLTQV